MKQIEEGETFEVTYEDYQNSSKYYADVFGCPLTTAARRHLELTNLDEVGACGKKIDGKTQNKPFAFRLDKPFDFRQYLKLEETKETFKTKIRRIS